MSRECRHILESVHPNASAGAFLRATAHTGLTTFCIESRSGGLLRLSAA